MSRALFGLLALLPMAIGPLPEKHRSMTAWLCNGGAITIPLNDDKAPRSCHPKGCHAGIGRDKKKRAD